MDGNAPAQAALAPAPRFRVAGTVVSRIDTWDYLASAIRAATSYHAARAQAGHRRLIVPQRGEHLVGVLP